MARPLLRAFGAVSLFIAASVSGAWELNSNTVFNADLLIRKSFDSNVYLQDEKPNRAAVPKAAEPFRESLLTTIAPRLALDYKPCAGFTASFSYSPEVVFYHSAKSEDHVTHRGTLNFSGKAGELAWEQPNSFTWIDGSDESLFFGGPGGAPAIGGVPIRDRRAAFIYRGGFKTTWNINERWFVRSVASAYVHEFFTDQLDSRLPQFRGYENYVDRNDVNGGLDFGRWIAENTRVFVGYRYGCQDEGHLITEPGIEYDNAYHRVLFGIEGQPWPWLKLNVALGPDFHRTTTTTRAGFDKDYAMLYVDGTATIMPTTNDAITLTMKQYTQPAFASCSVYEDTSYDVAYRHKCGVQWSAGVGFRAYLADWRIPIHRQDWVYTASAVLSYVHDQHLSGELSYSYDWAKSGVPNTEGREFTRHLVSLAVKYVF